MELKCPACGSEEIYRGVNRRKHMAVWYLSLLALGWLAAAVPALYPPLLPVALLWVAYPLYLPLLETWRCRACGTRAVSA
jgi:hypothetical protein